VSVVVGTRVGEGNGRGVKVSVTGSAVGAGVSGVGEAGSRAGVGIPHAEKIIIDKISDRNLSADANLIEQSPG